MQRQLNTPMSRKQLTKALTELVLENAAPDVGIRPITVVRVQNLLNPSVLGTFNDHIRSLNQRMYAHRENARQAAEKLGYTNAYIRTLEDERSRRGRHQRRIEGRQREVTSGVEKMGLGFKEKKPASKGLKKSQVSSWFAQAKKKKRKRRTRSAPKKKAAKTRVKKKQTKPAPKKEETPERAPEPVVKQTLPSVHPSGSRIHKKVFRQGIRSIR